MNAHDLQYGIEIETIAPDSAVRRDGLRIARTTTASKYRTCPPAGRLRTTVQSTTATAAISARS